MRDYTCGKCGETFGTNCDEDNCGLLRPTDTPYGDRGLTRR